MINKSIKQLSKELKEKKISVEEITKEYFNNIKKTDDELNCYITLCEDKAIESARNIQKTIDNENDISPLCGIPMAIKDNICTKDILTTCGSKMLENFTPPFDATVVGKLNSEGSVLLGKANMDEFAMGSTTENSYFKATKNPWDTTRVPGGSSGGPAAIVASKQAVFTLGSDTGGSIRQPASFCGVTGLKPTYGSVSRYGLVAFASSLDQIGPIAKSVEDCAYIMNGISGHDTMDTTSADIKYSDYAKDLDKDIKGKRIGIPKEYFGEGVNEEVKNSVLAACKKFEELGAICEECTLPMTEYAIPAYYIISSAEASSNLARYDGVKYGFSAKEFDGILDLYRKTRSQGFGKEVKRRIMLGTYTLSSGYYDAYYKKALQVRTIIMQEFEKAFDKYDAIIGPTAPTTAYKIGEKTDNPLEMYMGDIFTVSVNIAGLPALSMPCGYDKDNMPIGVQLIGKAYDESNILNLGHSFQKNTNFCRFPGEV